MSCAPGVWLCGAWCLQASGAALALVDAVVEASNKRTAGAEVPAGYSIARPPGHHATANQPMGFCLLNNVAIAARYAQQHHGLQKVHTVLRLHCNCYQLLKLGCAATTRNCMWVKQHMNSIVSACFMYMCTVLTSMTTVEMHWASLQVMILDWDVHHGNGTNDLFYDDDSVLMIDMHEDGVWPGSGQLQETGTGQGQGHTINIPMPSGFCRYAALPSALYDAANVFQLPSCSQSATRRTLAWYKQTKDTFVLLDPNLSLAHDDER